MAKSFLPRALGSLSENVPFDDGFPIMVKPGALASRHKKLSNLFKHNGAANVRPTRAHLKAKTFEFGSIFLIYKN
jgi:hypothetical protein